MPSLHCAHRELKFHKMGMSIACDTEDNRHGKTKGAIHWLPDTGFIGKTRFDAIWTLLSASPSRASRRAWKGGTVLQIARTL